MVGQHHGLVPIGQLCCNHSYPPDVLLSWLPAILAATWRPHSSNWPDPPSSRWWLTRPRHAVYLLHSHALVLAPGLTSVMAVGWSRGHALSLLHYVSSRAICTMSSWVSGSRSWRGGCTATVYCSTGPETTHGVCIGVHVQMSNWLRITLVLTIITLSEHCQVSGCGIPTHPSGLL